MEPIFSTYGALIGLILAIVLIVRKVTPAYALVFGALAGGLLGGGTLRARRMQRQQEAQAAAAKELDRGNAAAAATPKTIFFILLFSHLRQDAVHNNHKSIL